MSKYETTMVVLRLISALMFFAWAVKGEAGQDLLLGGAYVTLLASWWMLKKLFEDARETK